MIERNTFVITRLTKARYWSIEMKSTNLFAIRWSKNEQDNFILNCINKHNCDCCGPDRTPSFYTEQSTRHSQSIPGRFELIRKICWTINDWPFRAFSKHLHVEKRISTMCKCVEKNLSQTKKFLRVNGVYSLTPL